MSHPAGTPRAHRGTVADLPTAEPIGSLLPGVLQDDDLLMRFTGVVDQVQAAAVTTVDCLPSYVVPRLAPADHLTWLAEWVGVQLEETWPDERRRRAVEEAVVRHRLRGTAAGLRYELELASGGQVELTESGGVRWSAEPAELTEQDRAVPTVTLVVTGSEASQAELDEVAAAAKPAYVVHTLRVRPATAPDQP